MVRPAGMGPTMSVRTASLAATVTKDACEGTKHSSLLAGPTTVRLTS
jgi:hypothetical protein